MCAGYFFCRILGVYANVYALICSTTRCQQHLRDIVQPRKVVKPFIRKEQGESFVVVHRSQQDPKYYDEDESKHVLLSTKARLATPLNHGSLPGGSVIGGGEFHDGSSVISGFTQGTRMTRATRAPGGAAAGTDGSASVAGRTVARTVVGGKSVGGRSRAAGSVGGSVSSTSSRVSAVRRVHGRVVELSEVDEMGLPVDGYNYSQHFASGGGGIFMSKEGKLVRGSGASVSGRSVLERGDGSSVISSASIMEELVDGVYATHEAAARVHLPADVLPSVPEEEEDREDMLQAISLKPESMPQDLRKVLDILEEIDEHEDAEYLEAGEEADAAAVKAGKAGQAAAPASSSSSSAAAGSSIAAAPAKPTADSADRLPGYIHIEKVAADAGLEELDDNFVLQALGEMPVPEWPEGAVAVTGGKKAKQSKAGPGSNAAAGAGAAAAADDEDAEDDDEEDDEEEEEVDDNVYGDEAERRKKKAEEFDFEAHIQMLMARAEGQWVDSDDLHDGEEEEEDAEDGEEMEWIDDGDEEGEDGEWGYDGEEDGDDGEGGAIGDDGARPSLRSTRPGARQQSQAAAKAHDANAHAAAGRHGRIGEDLLSAMLAQYDDDAIGEGRYDDPMLRQDGYMGADAAPGAGDDDDEGDAADEGEENDDDEDDEGDHEDEDDDEDDDDDGSHPAAGPRTGASGVPTSLSSAKLLSSAIDEYVRVKQEGIFYDSLLMGYKNKPPVSSFKRAPVVTDDVEAEGAAGDASEAAPSAAGDVAEAAGAAGGDDADNEVAAITSGVAAASISAPAPVEQAKPKTAAFKISLGGFKLAAASTSAPAPAAVPAPSGPALPARPPSPVSSAAALVAERIQRKLAANGDGDVDIKNLKSDDGSRMIPFGWAEGDIRDDEIEEFPATWVQPKPTARWDVETIVSTYTNTENHPRKLDDGVSITSTRMSAGPRVLGEKSAHSRSGSASVAGNAAASEGHDNEGAAASEADHDRAETGSVYSASQGGNGGNAGTVGYSHGVIRLSRKTGLPLGRNAKQQLQSIEQVEEEEEQEEHDEEGEANENGDENDGDDNDGDSGDDGADIHLRKPDETPEERKLRKQAVKADRRAKRAAKKNLKVAYKTETMRQTVAAKAVDALGRGAIIVN